ncbi:Rhodanese- sulfurtransferase [Tieghemiomyces parasiticus]|uniref:Ribosome biogenesis regulatory protein n=1 Tax=Tieghemiomyces parasiticus TaxID=78921 RepID=A0A9W8DQC9_9FUNG|nr:Rhodanese- sulfurtransferase [Tieghemiomyces parasiticus]
MSQFKTTEVKKVIPLEYDLGLLMASDINLLNDDLLSSDDSAQLNRYLRKVTRDGAQLLINQIFAQPTSVVDNSVIAQLPPPVLAVPREKHIPKPKLATRWERFAKAKGIGLTKKSQMVYDEARGEYVPRWGRNGINQGEKDWLIEVKDGDDPFEDQYQKRRDAKRERVATNKRRHQRNLEEAAAADRSIGDPRSLRKAELQRALLTSKSSTASLGRFDRQLEGETKAKGIKRKFKPNTADTAEDKEATLRLAKKAVDGPKGAINVKKAIRKLK